MRTRHALVVLAHGSQDPRSPATVLSLVEQIRSLRPGLRVEAAFLDHNTPDLTTVIHQLGRHGVQDVALVPLLFTEAFHSRVDVPLAVARATARQPQVRVRTTLGLGTPTSLLAALDERLDERVDRTGAPEPDALVLTAAGSSRPEANEAVRRLAAAWGLRRGLPALASFASAEPPAASEAIRELRRQGFTRVAVGSLFLAPGRLWERATELSIEAGAITVSQPLGAHRAVAQEVLLRMNAQYARQIHAGNLTI